VLKEQRWPMAKPYRRLAAEPMADIATARQARGVSPERPPPG